MSQWLMSLYISCCLILRGRSQFHRWKSKRFHMEHSRMRKVARCHEGALQGRDTEFLGKRVNRKKWKTRSMCSPSFITLHVVFRHLYWAWEILSNYIQEHFSILLRRCETFDPTRVYKCNQVFLKVHKTVNSTYGSMKVVNHSIARWLGKCGLGSLLGKIQRRS